MIEWLIDLAYAISSSIIVASFLLVVSVLALWHNFIGAHIKSHHDFRDTRSSRTTVLPEDGSNWNRSVDSRYGPMTSTTRLDRNPNIEGDRENNIEIDHTVTSEGTRPDSGDGSTEVHEPWPPYDDLYKKRQEMEDNPFQDVLTAEDMKLVPDLAYYYRQYNIEIESFEVETDDGFIIDLWHLKHGDQQGSEMHPILMLHGLLQSSGSFASSGRKSLAYYMHQSGFDVWLGNNRCGLHPKWNKNIVGKNKRNRWDWGMDQMVQYDLKALVNYVLSHNQNEKLTLMAHSQGTTQGFMGLVNGELLYQDGFKLSEKIENFVALAPAVYPGPLLEEKAFVKFMAKGIDNPWIFGNKSFLPLMLFMRRITNGVVLIPFMSYVVFNYLFDWNDSLWDKPLRDRHFLFSPVYISVKLMQWWLSPCPSKISFKKGAGTLFPDSKTWFPVENGLPVAEPEGLHVNSPRQEPQDYPRLLLFIPRQDRLVDGERLIDHFINHESSSIYKIWYIDEYSHLDVLWAHDVIDRVGQPLANALRIPSRNKEAVKG